MFDLFILRICNPLNRLTDIDGKQRLRLSQTVWERVRFMVKDNNKNKIAYESDK